MASITTKKDKNGKIISYRLRACIGRDERGKQLWATATIPRPENLTPAKERKEVERLADQWEEEQREAMRMGKAAPNKANISFHKFTTEHWFPNAVEDGSHTPQTVDFYKHLSSNVINYFGPKIELKQIGVESIKRYLKYLQTEARTKNGEPLSLSTQKHHYDVLRIILRYALRVGYIRDDPTRRLLMSEKPRTEKKGIDFLNPEDTKRFLECLEEEPLFWRCLENVLIFTGVRRGECIGLQWGDLDVVNLCLLVERNVTLDEQAPEKYHIGKTKTGTSRTVPISKRLCDLLMELRAEREEAFGFIENDDFIFCRADNSHLPLSPATPTHWQRRFVKRNNLPNISPHGLRHTAASLALEGGAHIKQVQMLLGHADAATTMRFYTGITESAQRRAVEGIENLLER